MMSGRIGIDDVTPVVSQRRYPAKAVLGEHVPVRATVFREGHDAVGATLAWRAPGETRWRRRHMKLDDPGLDTWSATLVPDRLGEWTFRVDGWSDPWSTWRHGLRAKLDAGYPLASVTNELSDGIALLKRAAQRWRGLNHTILTTAAAMLRYPANASADSVEITLSDPGIMALMAARPLRDLLTRGYEHRILVEPEDALTGSWYELFPRSTGGTDADGDPVHGTFATAATALDRVAAMGFTVVYLPPIHPIGEALRKGRNNTLPATADDVGSPWGIGSVAGGHDAVEPRLGTYADFTAFVEYARSLGITVAMDLALQCAPDHPWVTEHPEWFTHRADGSIASAENPPKRYEDIYPLDFDADPAGLRAEIVRVLNHWIRAGVRVFRVDNPHTKPLDFWSHVLGEVRRDHPDVVFLSEAFTRPAMMRGLARIGFSQSYTYFTWRTTKAELTAYLTELVASADFMRPNLWVNTPDILPAHLVDAPPAAFAIRAGLAATLGPSWGVYSGFELFENVPLAPGAEEYLDSEKYELRPRDFAAARATGRSLEPWITRLNALRRDHPALGVLRTLRFHDIDDDALIAYSKHDPASGDTVLCVVNLDPVAAHSGTLTLDHVALGITADSPVVARDEMTGRETTWIGTGVVTVDPARHPALIFSLELK